MAPGRAPWTGAFPFCRGHGTGMVKFLSREQFRALGSSVSAADDPMIRPGAMAMPQRELADPMGLR